MNRLLLALDIDGTSVGHDCRLGEATKRALRAMRRQGHVVCFASGRHDADMANMKGDQYEADYLLCNTGGKLVRLRDDKLLFNRLVDPQAGRSMIEACLGSDCVLYAVAGSYIGINRMTPGVQEYLDWANIPAVFYHAPEEVPLHALEGFMASGHIAVALEAMRRGALALEYVYSEPRAIDIMPRGVNKWSGLLALCRIEHIAPENVVAVGNYLNDSHMIRNAGLGVAVADASPEIREMAKLVLSADHNHDAVAELVDRLLRA